MKKPLVLYHGQCLDGFTGAWVAWKKFGKKAEYIGLDHKKDPLTLPSDRKIYFIDFCYSAESIKDLVSRNPQVTILDHHVTSRESVRLAPDHLYATDHSGCYLAWTYFFSGKKVPHLVKIIEDNDLYTFKVPHTRELIATLPNAQFDFKQWSKLARDLDDSRIRNIWVKRGKMLLEYKVALIKRLLLTAEKVVFEGHTTYALNSHLFYSDAANAVWQTLGVHMGIAWSYKEGKMKISLRSDGTVDVAKLAQKFGGGGHKAAAGFWVPFKKGFPWKSFDSN